MSELLISRLSPEDMHAQRVELAAIHQAAFRAPDARMARYRDRDIPEMSLCPGLQCVATFVQQMIGFAIGYGDSGMIRECDACSAGNARCVLVA